MASARRVHRVWRESVWERRRSDGARRDTKEKTKVTEQPEVRWAGGETLRGLSLRLGSGRPTPADPEPSESESVRPLLRDLFPFPLCLRSNPRDHSPLSDISSSTVSFIASFFIFTANLLFFHSLNISSLWGGSYWKARVVPKVNSRLRPQMQHGKCSHFFGKQTWYHKRERLHSSVDLLMWIFKSLPYLDWSSINQTIKKNQTFHSQWKQHCQGFVNIFSFNKLIREFTHLSSQNVNNYIRPDDSFRPQTGKQNRYPVSLT